MQPQPGHVTRAHLLVNHLRSVFFIYNHGGIYRIISMVDYAIYTTMEVFEKFTLQRLTEVCTMVEYEKYTTCALYWDGSG